MEFSRNGGFTWINVTGASISSAQLGVEQIPAGQLLIRYRATSTAPHSVEWSSGVLIPAVPPPAFPPSPTPAVNAVNRTVTGVNSQMEFSRDNGATWVAITGSQISSAQLGPAAIAIGDLHIRLRATASAPASLPWISIIAIPAA
jgi:hypothetical protein